jgi:hypothetical protein
VSYPGPITPKPFETEDLKGNDNAIIESYDIEIDAPPNLKDATQPIPSTKVAQPVKYTRILTRSITIQPTWTPLPLFPSDPNRKNMTIRVASLGSDGTGNTPIATDGIRLTSDVGEITTAGIIVHGQTITDCFGDHNGPLYILATGTAANGAAQYNVRVDAWAVTL